MFALDLPQLALVATRIQTRQTGLAIHSFGGFGLELGDGREYLYSRTKFGAESTEQVPPGT
jgi:hypothetical protein